MEISETEKKARKNVLFTGDEVEGLDIKGFNFDEIKSKGISEETFDDFMNSFMTTGFQATHLAKAIKIIKKMREEKCTIYLGYTSNLMTSGLREIFCYLAKNKLVDVIVTTAGGIEEDFVKCFGPFKLGRFSASGELLAEKGVNRTGNIFVVNSRYCSFEDFVMPILEEMFEEQKNEGKIHSSSELIMRLASKIDNKESVYHWCYKNDIKVFCPTITDGSLGDMIHFFKYRHPEFKLDISDDIHELNEFTITRKKTGIIILGSGSMKHYILNSNMMRNGSDYAVYVNSGQEWDGADSSARPDEAVSWGKIKRRDEKESKEIEKGIDTNKDDSEKGTTNEYQDEEVTSIKVFGDATILFPLIVLSCFVE